MVSKTGLYGENTYTYDNVNRLTQESFTKGQSAGGIAPESYVMNYAYDNAGNRTRMEAGHIPMMD